MMLLAVEVNYGLYLGWLGFLVVLLVVVTYTANKLRTGDPFSLLERLAGAYLLVAFGVWLWAGHKGQAPLSAAWTAASWPADALAWARRALR